MLQHHGLHHVRLQNLVDVTCSTPESTAVLMSVAQRGSLDSVPCDLFGMSHPI